VILSTNICPTFRATSQFHWHPALTNCKLVRNQQMLKASTH